MSADDLLMGMLRGARWLRSLGVAVAFGLGAMSAAVALPVPPDNTVYANSGTTLYTVTPSTGAAVIVGTLQFSTNGFGRDPITGRVYYAEAALPGRVAYWDPTTATNTILPTSLGFVTNRMGFRADGQMFSMNPSTNNIYVIDRNTGNPTIVATVNGPSLNGGGDMAFAPNGDLYIVTASTIYRVLTNPIAVPPAGAVPALSTTSAATGTTGSPTGLTFIDNGVALGSPSTGIVDLGLTGGFTNARGANSYSDLGAMPKFADIAISVTPSSPSFPRTGSASYAVTVSNNGPQSASGNFTVTFTLPTGVTLVGAGPFGTGWSCVGGPAVTCTNTTASLVVGASLPTLSVPVTTSVAGGTNSLSTTFTVADTTFDSVTSNNSTTVLTSVGSATISKAFLTNPMAKGGTSTLVFTLTNPTASAFTGVSFSDTLPTAPGAMVVAATPNASTSGCGAPTFTPAAGNPSLAFSAGSIAAGGTCTVRVDITAPTSGSYANTSSGVVTTQTGAAAGAASNTASLLVMTPPTIAKSFAPSPVIPNGPSTLTITLSNPAANGANAITGANFTDVFPTAPGAMTLADTTITNGCGGTLSDAGGAALAAGSTAVKLVGGTVPANGSCVISVNVKAPTAGTYNNTTGVVGSANAGAGLVSNTASVVVQAVVAPSIAKDFSPAPIAVGATSTLTFTITNPNPTTALSGVAFSDTFPTSPGAMTVAATPAASTTGCGAATFAPAPNATSVAFSAGSIAAGGTCTVKVDITVNAVGAYTNVSGAVSATGPSALTGNATTATISTLAPPVVSKAFSPSTIGTGSISTVTITISNPNGTQAISGVALTDTLPTAPGAMKVAAVPNASVSGCGAPTFAPVANAVSAAFSNGTIAGGGLCTIKFDVTAPTAGTYSNTTGAIATTNGGSGVATTASLTVVATAPISITKSFLTNPMAANVPAVLRFVLTNPNTGTALTGVAFSDTFPTAPGAMVVAAAPGTSTSGCGAATFAPVAGAASVSFTGGSIPPSGTCTVDVKVTAPAAGTYANTTSTVTSTTPVTTGAAALANVDVLAAPIISKTFLTSPVAVNVPTTLRFDIANPNGLALANLSFTDLLPTAPGAMVVAPVPNVTTSAGCTSPSFTPSAGAASLAFSTGSIAAGATCRISVDVVVPTVGSYVNTSSAISSTNGGTGNTANATLTAVALNLPTLTKSFASAGPIAPGTPNALTLALGNSNASAISLSAALVDNLPAGMTVASPANSSGSCVGVTATPGDTKITLASGSSIPAGGCTVIANVVASTGGTFTNTLAAGALVTSAGSNASPASASFSVPFAPAATKSFTPSTVAVGATSVLKISLVNSNGATAVSGAAFTDTYPAGLVNTAAPAAAISGAGCSGTVTGAANGTSLALSAGVIPAGGTCDITVNVTSATAGNYLNSSGAIATTNVGSGNASSATLTVSVGAPLTVAKSFTASAVAPGATSVLRIRLTNPNGVAITGATFTDAYPAGLVNTAAPAGAISGAGCTGSVTAGVNGTSLALSAGNIPASSFCDITANVTSNTPGSYANNSGTVATTNGGTAASSSATLVVLSPPTVVKSFAPTAVSVSSPSVLKITITNANTGTALAGVAFTDSYPAGLVNTAAPASAISGVGCSGTATAAANGTSLALSAGVVPAGGSCDITVNVSSASAATYNNSSGPVATSNAGTGAAAIGTLSVVSGPAPLTVSKVFTPASMGTNDNTVLKITLQNPNATAVTGAAFTDTYPFSMFNTAAPASAISGAGCSGTVTAAANGSSLALSAGNVPASSSCDITVNVTSAAANTYVNSTGAVTTTNAGTSSSVNGTLVVLSHVTVLKAFTPTSVVAGSTSVLKITLTNPNAVAITSAAFTDTYPGGLVNTGSPAGAINGAGCSGTVTAAAGAASLALSAGNIPAGGSCDITVNVTSASAGSYVNNSGAVTTANAGAGASSGATLTVTAATVPLSVVKVFTPNSVGTGDSTVLKITLTNANAFAVTGAAFTDTYPASMLNTAVPAGAISGAGCSGPVTAAANGGSLALSAGNVPASGSCDITVNVSSATANTYVNSTGAVTTTNAGTSSSVNGTLVVLSHITVLKAFTPASVSTNATSVLKITLTNPNAVAITGAAFNDAYPGGLVNTGSPAGAINGAGCSGTVTAAAGGASLALSAGNIPASGSCDITVNVTSASAGSYVNNSGAVATANAGAGASSGATLTVTAATVPLGVAKVFTPNSVGTGDSTVLKITLTNSNAFAVTGAAFTDTYPASMLNTAAPAGTISGAGCSGTVTAAANGGSLALSAGNVPAGASCDITVNVSSATANTYVNSTGAVTTTNAGTSSSVNGTLVVLSHITVLKAFTPASVSTNATSVLKITLTNPNAVAITGAAFTDAYPGGLVNTGSPAGAINGAGCSGTVTAAAGGASLALSAGNIPASGSCDITVNVTSASAGSYVNNSGAVTTANAGAGASAGATLTVTAVAPPPAPQVTKVFTPNSIGTNGSTVLKIILVNLNAFALTSVAFTDSYPAGLVNTAAPGAAISGSAGCAGTVTAAANGSSLALSGGNLPANGSCDISVNVTSASAGTYVNSSGPVTSAEAPAGTAGSGTLTVLGHVTVLKSFTPSSVAVNTTSVLKITLTNPNAVAITGAAFNDAYPGGLVNTGSPAGAISGAGCSGTVTAAAGGTSLALSAGNVPAGSSCDITVNVTSAATGSYVNNSGAVSTANAGAGTSSGATLTVTAALVAPNVSKTFTPAVILTGDNSLLRVTITNPNAAAITSAAFTDTYPATLSNTGSAAFNAASIAAGCTGTISGASGTTSLTLSNGNIPVGVSCMIDVNVTSNSAVPVLLTNPAFSVSSANAPDGNAAAANLQVLVRPTIAKSFTPSTVVVGGASTLSLVITNPNPIPLTALAFTDTFPAGLNVATQPNAVNGCAGTFNAAAGAASISLSGGSLAANQSCTLSVAVSSAAAGAYNNTSGGVSSFETGAAGAASNTAVLTVNAPSGVQIEGFVYSDPNHNLQKDGGEAGTGLVLYAKLVAVGAPAGPASQAVVVDPATGAYLFSAVTPGEYFIVINGNATLADVTPAIPATWTGTEAGDQVRRNVVVAAVDLRYLNFGLFNGNLVSGRVFRDNGSGGGTPNNAVQDGTESGIGQVAVRLTNAAGATTYDSTTTDAAGNYRLWITAGLSGNSLRVVEDNAAAFRSVGGAPAGSYDRPTDTFSFTYTAGSNTANLNFADVAIETLTSPQQRTAAPGEVVFYAHTFTPGSGGSVAFSTTSGAGWPQTLFRDANCNGVLDAGEGVVSAPVVTTAGTPVCVIVKVTVPTGAAVGAQNTSTLQAVFSYSNASPPLTVTLGNDDQTTVGTTGGAALALVKSQDNASPLPGGRIVYTITYTNQGSGAITSIRINDATPAFTRFVSAVCVAPLAAGLSACNVTASPAAGASGAIEFTLTGALLPSASGQVSFSVDVASGP